MNGEASTRTAASDFPLSQRDTPASMEANPEAAVFRNWTPDHGIVPIDLTSPPFDAAHFLKVLITGNDVTFADQTAVWLECKTNGLRKEVFRGSVNIRLNAALVELPENWCPGQVVLRFHADARSPIDAQNVYSMAGAGSVFSVSLLSYLKVSFLGKIPFIVVTATMLVLLMLSGAALAVRYGQESLALPAALGFLGCVALGNFYLVSLLPHSLHWLGTVLVLALIGSVWKMGGRDTWRMAWRGLKPHLAVWLFGAGVFLAFSALATNGLGSWEPNYRFWPAAWSSDNELPWSYTEAIRHGWNLKNLWGGIWLPTDRPPLMAAIHLLYGDIFALMQVTNDGRYSAGSYYNAAAVLLNALWLPVCNWILLEFLPVLGRPLRRYVLLFVALLPFSVFNTIYGWPKALGAAFALVSFGLLMLNLFEIQRKESRIRWRLACLLAALSYLSHGSNAFFLAPMLLFYMAWFGRRDIFGMAQGLGIAFVMLLTWTTYKTLVLPSTDPLTKYALTGDFGFGNAQSLWTMLKVQYATLGFAGWLEIKKALLTQLFVPVYDTTARFGLNHDFGATALDRLRAWDFSMLSKGNIFLPAVVMLGLWGVMPFRRPPNNVTGGSREVSPFLLLLVCSVLAVFFVISVFLAPVILHTLPYAAVFGAALGGGALLVRRTPRTFLFLLVLQGGYTAAIWGVIPIANSLSVDVTAAGILFGMIFFALLADSSNQGVGE